MQLLLVEDDNNLSRELKQQLLAESIQVDTAFDGLIAERMIAQNDYHLILADINLPGKSGYELVQSIRKAGNSIPVIIITAFGEMNDKLFGFDCGADDYLIKPFYFKELLARIKAILKRSGKYAESDLIIYEDLVIDTRKREVKRRNNLIRLTLREYEILEMLAESKGEPISKSDLLSKVWGTSFSANSNTIEVFINLLRNKIDKDFEPKLIKTRIGQGYYLGTN